MVYEQKDYEITTEFEISILAFIAVHILNSTQMLCHKYILQQEIFLIFKRSG